MKSVYLAGPIADLSYSEATDWRGDIKQSFEMWGVKALCPMRNHEHLTTVQRLSKTEPQGSDLLPTRTRKGIMSRDFYDVRTCDVIFVNLLGAQRISIGTTMEIAWAYQNRTPIVAVMEPDNTNIHEHGMLNEAIDFRCKDLVEGVRTTLSVLDISCPLSKPVVTTIQAKVDSEEIARAVEARMKRDFEKMHIVGRNQ